MHSLTSQKHYTH